MGEWYNYLYVWIEIGGMKVLCLENILIGAIGVRGRGGGGDGVVVFFFFL